MLIVEVNKGNSKETYEVDNLENGKKLADVMFETTGSTCKVIDVISNVLYERMTPKDKFLEQPALVQQNALMETAMRIMDVFCDLQFANRLNPYKVDNKSYRERLQLFCTWAREYEETYYDTDAYVDDFTNHISDVFTPKLMDEFAGEC